MYTSAPFMWLTGLDDEVTATRASEAAPHILDSPSGFIAAIGHPNVTGAQRYGDKINAKLDSIRSQWDLAQAMKLMQAAISPRLSVEIQAHSVSGGGTAGSQEKTFTVTCTDASTGSPVDAQVFIGRSLVGRTNRPIAHKFHYAKHGSTETGQPAITVSRQGYLDKGVSYDWNIRP